VVLGFPHRAQGEEVGAYVEASAVRNGERQRLTAAIEGLPPEIRPKVVIVGEEPIPRTHTGKIQRRKLQPLFATFDDARGPLRFETRL
jgi:long-chain acyl-CoA synthetase